MSLPRVLDTFRRYELKYLADGVVVPALLDGFGRHLDRDAHAGTDGYDVWSLYYDSPQLTFYWDRVDGRPFRQKLRVRHYGATVDAESTVYVEIKQEVDRLTEKRRIVLPYAMARQLCDDRVMVDRCAGDRAFLAEVLRLVSRLDLRRVSLVSYRRAAFVGRGREDGLRVTLDSEIRGRDRAFGLDAVTLDEPIVSPSRSMLEVKAAGRVPYWLTDLIARHRLTMVRFSKYCQSVEVFGRAPRSAYHILDPAGVR